MHIQNTSPIQSSFSDFKRCSKDNPEKVIVVVQALEGVLGKHIQENIEIFEKNGAVMSTAEPSFWS